MSVYCRFESNGRIEYGEVSGNEVIILDKEPWFDGIPGGEVARLSEIRLLAPSVPKVIVGLGGSYREVWSNQNPPKSVRWFIKPPGSAAGWNDDIILPASLDEIKVEVELVIVLGREVKDVDEKEAHDSIFGFTVGNDVVGTVDSYYRMTGENGDFSENLLAPGLKACDRFAPFGPFIYTGIDWRGRKRSLKILNADGAERVFYENSTSGLLYSPEKIVSDLSKVLTLSPGDIIMTGTTKSFPVYHGESVEISIEGMGTIINKIL